MSKALRIDGDIIVYRAGFAAERMVYFVDDSNGEQTHQFDYKAQAMAHCQQLGLDEANWNIQGVRKLEPVANALHNAKSIVEHCTRAYPDFEPVIYLSGDTNFREGVAVTKPYKGNRDKAHKPQHGPAIKEYLSKKYRTIWSVDEEADDAIGIDHCLDFFGGLSDSSIICSLDKDLNMLPGHHYNFATDTGYYVTEEEAEKFFWKQMITGDPTDNIPGIEGKGPKAAACIDELGTYEEMEAHVFQMYCDKYGEDADRKFVEMGRLLWIRREPDQWWKRNMRMY